MTPALRLLCSRPPATLLLACLALSGCATIQVQRLATGGLEAAYNLEGTNLSQLEAEAGRLCPHGYDTRRQWENYQHLNNDQIYYARLWERIGQTFSAPTTGKAQMAVLCKPPAAAAPVQAAPGASTPASP